MCLAINSDIFPAQCSLSFLFPTVLHRRAPFRIRTECVPSIDKHLYELRSSVEACMTSCDPSHPLYLHADPLGV